jgi:hypothetical protein
MILNILDTPKNLSGKDTNIIVTRYDEGLSWIKPYLDYSIIYNKGDDNLPYPYIRLKNIGLEHHSWVHHIVNNYDTLPNHLIFLQGSPHYHFIGNVERFLDRFLDLERRKKIQVEDFDYIPLTDWYTTENINETELFETYVELFGKEPEFKKVEYATCGQFCVSSERIRHYSKSFYKKYLNIFERKNNIDYAYTAERMWSVLYSQKYLVL